MFYDYMIYIVFIINCLMKHWNDIMQNRNEKIA